MVFCNSIINCFIHLLFKVSIRVFACSIIIFISAKEKTNIPELKALLYEEVKRIHAIRYPYNNFLY